MNKQKKPLPQDLVDSYIAELKKSIDLLDKKAIYEAIDLLIEAYKNDKKVFIFGNGGSASIASHMACDLGKGTLRREYDEKEKRFRVISLTDNLPLITAYANDLSYEDIFIQQLRNLVEKDDVVIALSGSGNSRNVIKAVLYAKRNGAKTIGFLGFKTGGKLAGLVDCAVIAQSSHYGPCEDIQLILDHVITSTLAQMKHLHDGYKTKVKNKAVPFRG